MISSDQSGYADAQARTHSGMISSSQSGYADEQAKAAASKSDPISFLETLWYETKWFTLGIWFNKPIVNV